MRYEGNLEVLENLFRKQRLLATCDVDHLRYRTLLLDCPGFMRGTYGVGQAFALHRFRLNHVFDVVFGVSTGLPTLAYFLTKQERNSIYWKEAASEDFISLKRFLLGKGPYVNIDYICKVFGDINQRAARECRPEFWGGATCAVTGSPIFLNMKEGSDMVERIRASIALPGFADSVRIGENLCIDGATAMTFPVRQAIERFDPTDVLVLANRSDLANRSAFLDTLISMCTMYKLPQAVQCVDARRYRQAQKELDFARSQKKVRIGILWSDKEIGRTERDSDKLKYAAVRAENHLMGLLTEAKAHVDAEQAQKFAAE